MADTDWCRCYTTPGVAAADFDGLAHWRWDCLYINARERETLRALYTDAARAKGLLDAEGNFLPRAAPTPRRAPQGDEMKTGVELIAAERQRQIEKEGWTASHDDDHDDGELALAAACYANPTRGVSFPPNFWPWAEEWWKPSPGDRVRELVKAGALLAAEIDRLQRGHPKEGK